MNLKNMFKKIISNSEVMPPPTATPIVAKERLKIKQWLFLILVALAVGGTIGSVYYFRQYQALKANPNLEAQRETEALVAAIGKLMELPADETPTMATILEKEKLQDQPFFVRAENGDKLLAYTKAMQAILYRPSAKKIINVAPIVINQPKGTSQNKPVSQAPVGLKIAYFNGTEAIGLSGQAEKIIKASYPDYQTGALTNAKKKDYKETLVIDITGTHSKETEDIASLLGGKISSLPNDESRPDADILIISGK